MTPVIIILYNRPKHSLELLNSISKANNSNKHKFYIFCDGPKNINDQKKIIEIKKILKRFKKKLNLKINFRKKNLGLQNNIVKSISSVLKKDNKVIILEDDLILNPNFFLFMEAALNKYKNSNKVLQISGYSYPILNNNSHYFLPLTSCWGWGITKKNWNEFLNFYKNYHFLESEYLLIKKSKNLKNSFNFNDSYNYFAMLENFFKKKINSWGIIFYLYLFIENKISLFPNNSLIKNNGFDGTGNHKSKTDVFNIKFMLDQKGNFPNKIMLKYSHIKKVELFFKKNLTLYAKVKNKLYEKIF